MNNEKELRVIDLVGIYKGTSPISDNKLLKLRNSFRQNGKIMLRGGERAIFLTNAVKIKSYSIDDDIYIKKGLLVHQLSGDDSTKFLLTNNTTFLVTIHQYQKIGTYIEENEI